MLSLKTHLKVSFCSVNLNKPGNIVPKRSLVVSLHAEVSVTTASTRSMSDVNDHQRYKNEAQFVKKRFIFSQNTDYFNLLVLTNKGRRVILNPQQQKKYKKSCFRQTIWLLILLKSCCPADFSQERQNKVFNFCGCDETLQTILDPFVCFGVTSCCCFLQIISDVVSSDAQQTPEGHVGKQSAHSSARSALACSRPARRAAWTYGGHLCGPGDVRTSWPGEIWGGERGEERQTDGRLLIRANANGAGWHTHTHREPRSLLQTIKLCTFPSENHPAFNREGCQRLGVIGKIRAERFDIFYETLCSRSLSSGSDASVEYNFAQSLECWTTQRGKYTFHFFELKNESSARHRRLFWHAWNFWGSRGRKRTAIIQKTRRCCGLN